MVCSSRRMGRRSLFADFYDQMAPAVLGFFARRVRDPQLAFDLTAETFVKAFEKRFGFRGSTGEQAAAWLFAIARNELAMYSRSNKAARAALERVGIAPHALADDDLQKVEELGATEEAREQVRAALDELPHGSARGRQTPLRRRTDRTPRSQLRSVSQTMWSVLVRPEGCAASRPRSGSGPPSRCSTNEQPRPASLPARRPR